MHHGGAHHHLPTRLTLLSDEPNLPVRADARRAYLAILTFATVATGFAASPVIDSIPARIGLASAALAICAAAWLLARWRAGKVNAASTPDALLVDEHSILLTEANGSRSRPLIPIAPGFGLTLLANAERTRLVVGVTSGKRLLFVGAALDAADRRRFDFILPHAVTACREDLSMAMQSTRGRTLIVDAESLLRLIDILTQVDATALGRVVMTDNAGREVVLDGDRLQTPRGTIRLDQPFEWRALHFREGSGAMDAEFQGTWVRQGKHEIVLVALQTDDVRRSIHDLCTRDGPAPDPMLRTDARLAAGCTAAPPPFEQRIAVDRLFMLPVRRALDGARWEARDSIPGGASVG